MTLVTTSQAGQTVPCSCGVQLEVPTLRGLRQLPAGEAPFDSPSSRWENRQRAIFTLVLISLAALALGSYLWMRLPAPAVIYSAEQIKAAFAAGRADEIYDVYEDLRRGINHRRFDPSEDRRSVMHMAMLISLAIGTASMIAALYAAFRPGTAERGNGPARTEGSSG